MIENAGQSVRIPCAPPEGYPDPEVTWYKNGDFFLIDGQRIKYEDNALIITELYDTDTGFYACRAENAAGKMISKAARLQVNSK